MAKSYHFIKLHFSLAFIIHRKQKVLIIFSNVFLLLLCGIHINNMQAYFRVVDCKIINTNNFKINRNERNIQYKNYLE